MIFDGRDLIENSTVIEKFCWTSARVSKFAIYLRQIKRELQTIGFISGCFDIFHIGHLNLINKAKENCDCLIIGLNSDASVRDLKGESRPINNETNRSKILFALKDVDCVVKFHGETPIELIHLIRPDFIFRGEEGTGFVGKDFVESYGGKAIEFPKLNAISTTEIINKAHESKNIIQIRPAEGLKMIRMHE